MADRRFAVLAAAVAAALLLTGCGGSGGNDPLVSGVQTPGNHGYQGIYLAKDPYQLPDVALTDTSGEQLSLARTDAPLKLVFFGYTKCPDICQIVMSTIASALTRLSDAQRDQVEVAFVTTDPARDTESALRTYLDRFDDGFATDFIGLTGPLPTISELATPLKVFLEKGQKLPSGGYEVDHTTYAYAVLGTDTRVIWDQATSPAEMAKDIKKLLASKENS